jgi:two-component system NarL family sensor kinase
MGEVVVLAPAGAGDELEQAGHGARTEQAGLPDARVEAMRRQLRRLAFDVHDGPMQDLIAISWRLVSARGDVVKEGGESATIAAVLDAFIADLGRVEKGLRSLMLSIEHSTTPRDSLRVPIDEHVVAFKQRMSAQVDVSVTGDVEPRTDSQRIALERVLRESLSNIAKHAHAEHVAITLRGTDESIELTIRDDGCGFDPHAHMDARHMGLRAMGELLRMLGGRYKVDSRLGGPTTVTAELRKWQPLGPGLR